MTSLIYGKIYHIENGFNGWKGGYLDVCGFSPCCKENLYDVSTSQSFSLEKINCTWKIKSAGGKMDGMPVVTNDSIYLINQYGKKSYLNVCEGGIYIKNVSTATKKIKDTMVWIILAHSSGEIYENETVSLLNESSILEKEGYLSINKNPPICTENLFNVSVACNSSDFITEDIQWRFVGLKD